MFKLSSMRITILLISVSTLVACGGSGGGSSTESINNDPDADDSAAVAISAIYDEALLVPAEGGAGSSFNDGASWTHYNKGAQLSWQNAGGDYIDANGDAQGAVPWAVQTISDTNSVTDVEWDVTTLVQAWNRGDYKNRGFHLRRVSGSNGPLDYATKEADDSSRHPMLTITTDNAEVIVLSATGDTYLTPSSSTATYGRNASMRVRDNNNILVWFDLSSLNNKVITAASLKLTTIAQFTNSDVVHGVFAIKTGSWDLSSPVLGIAEQYPGDVGISTHPDVYLSYSFDSNSAADGGEDFLNDSIDTGNADNYWPCDTLAPSGRQSDGLMSIPAVAIPGYQPFQNGNAVCMRLKYEAGAPNTQGLGNYGVSARKKVSDFLASDQTDELFVRHYVFLGETWGENILNEGGKRPGGITGTQSNTSYAAGWGGRTTNGANGWSARGGYIRQVPYDYNPLEGYTAFATYLYHADQVGSYGDQLNWTATTPNGLIKKGRWYSIEQQVKMNTRDGLNIQGSSGAYDGIVRGWVDGRLVFEKTDVRFTDMDYINIDVADFGLYYGGPGNTPYDQHLAIDNIVISKSYIGPMKIN